MVRRYKELGLRPTVYDNRHPGGNGAKHETRYCRPLEEPRKTIPSFLMITNVHVTPISLSSRHASASHV